MKTKAFNIWFYAPTMVWFAFSLVTIVGSICSIAMGVGTNNINQDLIIFLKEIVYVVINLLIAVCLSNERTRINIFSFIPITVM
ncbi:MAG: hypothetical protein IJ809_00245, partial [Clostridia bacterium]|nr:hypothetical protein [Clostridia bacterium]